MNAVSIRIAPRRRLHIGLSVKVVTSPRPVAPEYQRVQFINLGPWVAQAYRGRFYVGYSRASQSYWASPRGLHRVPRLVYFAIVKQMHRRWHS